MRGPPPEHLGGKKFHFWPFWAILTPLTPWSSQTRIFPGSRIPKSFVYRLFSCFWKVSEKSNEQKKIYGTKSFIFGYFGSFWPLLTPWGSQTRIFSGSRIPKSFVYRLCSCFWKVSEKSNEQKKNNGAKSFIFEQSGPFCPPFRPGVKKKQIFPVSRISKSFVYRLCSYFWRVSENSNVWKKIYGAKSFIFGHFGAFWPLWPPGVHKHEFS